MDARIENHAILGKENRDELNGTKSFDFTSNNNTNELKSKKID